MIYMGLGPTSHKIGMISFPFAFYFPLNLNLSIFLHFIFFVLFNIKFFFFSFSFYPISNKEKDEEKFPEGLRNYIKQDTSILFNSYLFFKYIKI